MKVTIDAGDASIAAGAVHIIQHRIEGLVSDQLRFGTSDAKTVTISFWIRSPVTGVHYVSLRNSALDRSYPAPYTISSADTWEHHSVTIPGDTSGTWLTTNGVGIRLSWCFGAGSTYQGTASSWEGANDVAASDQVNAVASSADVIYLTGCQLEVGATATDFEHRDIASELARCHRYCWVHDGAKGATNSHIAFLHAINTTNAKGAIHPPAEMRATPTLTITGTIQGSVSGTLADTAPTISGSGSQTIGLNVTRTGGWSAANDIALITHDGTGTKMIFDAEL